MADNAPAPATTAVTPATNATPQATPVAAAKPNEPVVAKPVETKTETTVETKPEVKPEDAATLRQLASATAEARNLKAQLSSLTAKVKELETNGGTLAEKAKAADKLEALEKRLREEPHRLLSEFGHTRDRKFFDEIVAAYTDDPAELQDPRVDELSKSLKALQDEREAEKSQRTKDEEARQKRELEAAQAEEQKTVKTWAGQLAGKDTVRWPILSNEKMSDVRDAVALRVLDEASKQMAERRKADPKAELSEEEGTRWMQDGLDQAEKALRAELDRLSEVVGAKTTNATTEAAKVNQTGRVLGQPRATIDSSVRAPLHTPTTKPLFQGGPRRLGMPIGRN